jgi:hypothetical protein
MLHWQLHDRQLALALQLGQCAASAVGSGAHPGRTGTREEPGTLTQGVSLFSLVPLPLCVCFITAGPSTKLFAWGEGG